MALGTTCQTPDAVFTTHINDTTIVVKVENVKPLVKLTEQEATLLEANLHNAIELVLARYYK